MEQAFQDYVTRMAKIRHLSLPAIHDVDSAEAYRDRLCESFDAIGRLALENRAFLNETLYPLLRSDEALTPEMAENLRALCEQLFFVGGIEEDENLDLPVMSMIIQRLVVDTRQKGEISKLFDLNKLELFADYGMMDVARRIVVNPQFAAEFAHRGYEAIRFCHDWVGYDQFQSIAAPENREIVLNILRFGTYFMNSAEKQLQHIANISDAFEALCATDPAYFSSIKAIPMSDSAARETATSPDGSPKPIICGCYGMSMTAATPPITRPTAVGKIPIIDTIFMYGRALLDAEFDFIKAHSDLGYRMLSNVPSTRAYADVARGHHRFYNDKGGYPPEFITAASPVKTVIDVVCCADCLDAATDTVGRSYNKGKKLDALLEELKAESGTRYAPYAVALLQQEDVRRDIDRLLTEGREDVYRETFTLLRRLKNG